MDDKQVKILLDARGYSFEGCRRVRKLDLTAIRYHYPSNRVANETARAERTHRKVFFPRHQNDKRKEPPWPRTSMSA